MYRALLGESRLKEVQTQARMFLANSPDET
jgi:hypothetical protein